MCEPVLLTNNKHWNHQCQVDLKTTCICWLQPNSALVLIFILFCAALVLSPWKSQWCMLVNLHDWDCIVPDSGQQLFPSSLAKQCPWKSHQYEAVWCILQKRFIGNMKQLAWLHSKQNHFLNSNLVQTLLC